MRNTIIMVLALLLVACSSAPPGPIRGGDGSGQGVCTGTRLKCGR